MLKAVNLQRNFHSKSKSQKYFVRKYNWSWPSIGDARSQVWTWWTSSTDLCIWFIIKKTMTQENVLISPLLSSHSFHFHHDFHCMIILTSLCWFDHLDCLWSLMRAVDDGQQKQDLFHPTGFPWWHLWWAGRSDHDQQIQESVGELLPVCLISLVWLLDQSLMMASLVFRSYDKKAAPVSMSKLLSHGYVEEKKTSNDDDASSTLLCSYQIYKG